MNPLGNGNINMSGLPPQMLQNIQQVKGLMQMANGNPMALAQQNPMVGQIMQMCKGQNPQQIFYAMCQQQGINPNEIINELFKK